MKEVFWAFSWAENLSFITAKDVQWLRTGRLKKNALGGDKAFVFDAALARCLSHNYECCWLAISLCRGINNSRAMGQQHTFLSALRLLLLSPVRPVPWIISGYQESLHWLQWEQNWTLSGCQRRTLIKAALAASILFKEVVTCFDSSALHI